MSARAVNRLWAQLARRRARLDSILAAWDRTSALLFVVEDPARPEAGRTWRTLAPAPGGAQFNLTHWDGDGAAGHAGFFAGQLHEAVSYALAGGGRVATEAERASFERESRGA